jgi:hypothetical protein
MRRSIAALLFVLVAPPAAAASGDAPRYAVEIDPATQVATVAACLDAAHPQVMFAADSGWAMRFVEAVVRDGERAVEKTGDGWRARDWRAGECLHYRAALGRIADQHDADVGWRRGADFVAAPQFWLMRPDVQDDAEATVTIGLPRGWNVSAPWLELDRDGSRVRFRVPNTPANWSAAVAFGRFTEQRIALPGGVLRLPILGDVAEPQRAVLRSWLDRVARASLSAYGRLPLAEVQVLMIPVDGGRGAVMFGQSVRGQGNALELLIDPTRPASEFADDWMAVHELSHLMHPYLGDRGAWLSEGLATYYQNLLRGRSGLLTPVQAWDRLHEGFQRGAKAADDTTLEQIAQEMHRNHAFQRVYWAGAAFWLTVDRDLRRSSHGALSLDVALSRFRDCCLPAYRQWRPEDFVARLDALTGTTTFSSRYREFAQMRRFPDWQGVFADLGIDVDGQRLRFDARAPDAAVREAIMTMPELAPVAERGARSASAQR